MEQTPQMNPWYLLQFGSTDSEGMIQTNNSIEEEAQASEDEDDKRVYIHLQGIRKICYIYRIKM